MHSGETVLQVRAALLSLFLRRLGLDRSDGLVELANRDDAQREINRINGRFASQGGDDGKPAHAPLPLQVQ